jgi:phosphoribosylformimino-5-aminoimidazole carboxamide ribotide isomerase
MKAFLQISGFKIIYLADLNAITGQGNNKSLIESLLTRYPKILFWIDSGYQSRAFAYRDFANVKQVLGTEYYRDENLATMELFAKNFILSLDFSERDEKLGSSRLFREPDLLPEQVIIMTLGRVGSNFGPDFEKLLFYQKLMEGVEIIASGGIRNMADVQQLGRLGIKKALCASALHNKSISLDDLKAEIFVGC